VLLASAYLSSCASPYFVHDPRTLVVDREEVPKLLKSLRCELATFLAANNQRNILFAAEAKTNGLESAAEKYQYYEIDPKRFGTVTLSLQIQDFAGLQSGTQIDSLATHDAGVHTHFLDIGPTASDQSTYIATWNFAVPQDAITLYAARSDSAAPYSCYADIPKRDPVPFGSVYAEADLEALAKNDVPQDALFKRVWVNNTIPLAAWLEDVGDSLTQSTLNWHDVRQKPDRIIPAQMTYTFVVQISGGLDVKYGLTAPKWPLLAAEVAGTMQKTNTIAMTLNGIESYDWYLAQDGAAINAEAVPLPTIKVRGHGELLPNYIGRRQPRGRPEYPGVLLPRGQSSQP
jgi:hypothetical protein